MTQITNFRRAEFDGVGTLEGLLTLVGQIPAEIPLDAHITLADNYFGCPPEAHEDPDIEHEHGPRVGFVLEWEAGE